MHFTGEAPLVKSVSLVEEPSLVKVLVIKEKDLEQVVGIDTHQTDERISWIDSANKATQETWEKMPQLFVR